MNINLEPNIIKISKLPEFDIYSSTDVKHEFEENNIYKTDRLTIK